MRRAPFFSRMPLNVKLRLILLSIFLPLIMLIAMSLWMLRSYSNRYASILKNVTVATEFNLDFKESLDLKMYYFVIGSKGNIDHLPLEDVEYAEEVAQRLSKSTVLTANQRRISSILNLCANLKKCMIDIEDTEKYDDRQEKLANNIRIITSLIKTTIHEYIYFEAAYLSDLQDSMVTEVNRLIITVAAGATALTFILIILSLRFTNSITRPLRELSLNVQQVGTGDFTIRPVETQTDEIFILSNGFENMVRRIDALVERIRTEQNSLRHAEIKLLQAQIKPHFLYNTLDAIIWLAETKREEEVVRMVESLSTFFRTSLSNGQDIITLREEESHVRSYLEIQQTRYMDVLKYNISIPEQLRNCRIPKLTLQPLVENALYHGIKNRRGAGMITVTAKPCGNDFCVIVADDGAGMDAKRLEIIRSELLGVGRVGFGIPNVNERIQLYFGKEYGLNIFSQSGEGTRVEILLPTVAQL